MKGTRSGSQARKPVDKMRSLLLQLRKRVVAGLAASHLWSAWSHFADREQRAGYVQGQVNSGIALQLKRLREDRGLTQGELAEALGTKQSVVSRMERVDYGSWNLRTLLRIAEVFDCALSVRWVGFGEFAQQTESLRAAGRYGLAVPAIHADPAFFPWVPDAPNATESRERAVQLMLHDWLQAPAPDPAVLRRWLLGKDLPAIGDNTEPLEWIANAIVRWSLPSDALNHWARALLKPLANPAEFFAPANAEYAQRLLLLIKETADRDRYWPALRSAYEYLEKGSCQVSETLLRSFTAAVLPNQATNYLEDDWKRIASGAPHPVLHCEPDEAESALFRLAETERQACAKIAAEHVRKLHNTVDMVAVLRAFSAGATPELRAAIFDCGINNFEWNILQMNAFVFAIAGAEKIKHDESVWAEIVAIYQCLPTDIAKSSFESTLSRVIKEEKIATEILQPAFA